MARPKSSPPAHSLNTLRAWMRDEGIPALLLRADTAEAVPVTLTPARVCRHCRLPIGAAGPHGACEAHESRRAA